MVKCYTLLTLQRSTRRFPINSYLNLLSWLISIICFDTILAMVVSLFCSFFTFLLFQSAFGNSVYNISLSQPLSPEQTLLSPGRILELGFFQPNGSSSRYIGIWYRDISPSKVVWVANRENPLANDDQLASFGIGGDGNLNLLDGRNNVVWSTNVTLQSNDTVAVLLDDGNLVLSGRSSGQDLWASFDHPSDTFMVGMKMGVNVRTGVKQYFTSWKSDSDPSPGDYVLGISPEAPPQLFIWKGSAVYFRSGQWDRTKFIGLPTMASQTYLSGFNVEQDLQQGTTYLYVIDTDSSWKGILYISAYGAATFSTWQDRAKASVTMWGATSTNCQIYGTCGPSGVCSESKSPICRCLEGFVPKSREEWRRGNWTGGCVRRPELSCARNKAAGASYTSGSKREDRFLKMSRIKPPDSSTYLSNLKDPGQCQSWCRTNCSCSAYSYVSTIGCLVWTGEELIDTVEFSEQGQGQDLFLRLSGGHKSSRNLVISLATVSSFLVLGAALCVLYRRRATGKGDSLPGTAKKGRLGKEDEIELPVFSLKTILTATNNFGKANKLGQGGFGPVYKGKLPSSVVVAVKRLSSSSGQGLEEFKNEVMLISKLQHRNLIKLLGCCFKDEEKILVYEYMPNKSLDTFLFDAERKAELNWEIRFHIIHGVARGLNYLHHDSCLRVIHRDLKASNILLDEKMNPKISDFGLARMFEATQDLVNTGRVVGTLGYMSPEYAMGGTFSEKSDVYSFGVLLLEIVSGLKNTATLSFNGQPCTLLAYAWGLWINGRGLELMDSSLSDPAPVSDVTRCIHIGLLCVQERAIDRPIMPDLLLMLSGESVLPEPNPPAFTFHSSSNRDIPPQKESTRSRIVVTDSLVEGR